LILIHQIEKELEYGLCTGELNSTTFQSLEGLRQAVESLQARVQKLEDESVEYPVGRAEYLIHRHRLNLSPILSIDELTEEPTDGPDG